MLCRALRLQDAEAEYRAAKALYERTLHPARPSADAAACFDVNADRCASGAAMADDEWLAALPEREAQPEDDEMQPSSPGGTDVRDSREKGAKLRGLVGKFWVGWGAPLGAATAAATAAADAGKSGERLVQERRRSKLHSWLHRTSATAGDGGGTGEGGGCTGGEGCGARWAAVFSKEQWAEAILQQAMLSGSQAHALVCICVRVQANATCARSARGSSLWHLRLAYASVRALHHAPWGDAWRQTPARRCAGGSAPVDAALRHRWPRGAVIGAVARPRPAKRRGHSIGGGCAGVCRRGR